MKNNFNFNASIKIKDLEKMTKLISLLENEKVNNSDYQICISFRNLLNNYDNCGKIILYDLIDDFAKFYETFLLPYCKSTQGGIVCERFEEFGFEQIQYVMDKMKEIIYILCGTYGM